MRKKRRVPVVLWRLFGDKARTLYTTITSLIPQLCLRQPRDPSHYIKLLNHCFVVLNDNAPPFVAPKFPPHSHWPQHEIVMRTIEMMVRDQSHSSSNVLCSAYDKCNHSSPIVDLLSSAAWSLLLKRVGDNFMIYLLKHASIFLPIPPKKHCQVAGPPVNNLVLKLTKHVAEARRQDPSVVHFGHDKKKHTVENGNSMSMMQHNPLCVRACIGCITCNDSYVKPFGRHPGNKDQMNVSEVVAPTIAADSAEHKGHLNEEPVNLRKRSRPFRWQRRKKHKHSDSDTSKSSNMPMNRQPANRCQMSVLEGASPTTGACTGNHDGFLIRKLQGLGQVMATANPKKHSRLFRWQRCKKPRHLDVEANDKTCNLVDCVDEDTTHGRLQCDFTSIKSHSHDKVLQQCTCCLVLQDSHLLAKGAQINRQSIFYNLERSSSVLPRKQFFKILIRRTRCCKHLQLLDKHCTVPSSTPETNQNVSAMFEENHPERNVRKRSGSVGTEHCNRTSALENTQTETIKSYCSRSQVVSFIWAVCRNLVPPELLGTPSNWRMLRRNISKFIQLRRFEKFSIKQCMHKLKTSELPFLSDKHPLCCLNDGVLDNVPKGPHKLNDAASNLKYMLLEKWIFWFFSFLVVPLLQANFYVTESEHGKQDVFYYRKPIWEKLKNTTIAGLKNQNYKHLDPSEVTRIVGNRLFGFSKLRLRPKENGARMLANLKAASRLLVQESSSTGIPGKAQFCSKSFRYKNFKPVNYVLRDTYAVLKGILLKEPEKLGSSVFDYNDIYKKLCPFIIGLKNGLSTIPSVYIVVSDVSKAFDSIDQDQLLSVMKDILHEDEYLLQQSSQVVCTKKSLWVHENVTLTDRDTSAGFTKKGGSSARFGSLHTVFVNQGIGRYMKKKEIIFNLYEHVKRNVLQLDKTFYLQGIGIPQGSVLSSLLCSIYYGHLERNVLYPFIEKTRGPTVEDSSRRYNCQDASAAGNSSDSRVVSSPCHILLRLIDDLCFISTSKKQADSFYTRVQRGFRDYNCYMNEGKFCLSFDSGHELELASNRVYVGEDGISFLRWSGLLLNSCSLEVQADYTRYLNNHLRSTLTVTWQGKPGRHLKAKLCAFMRPKCHPIFFDSNINSGPVVRLNIYQAFLLCAMKFHCYISEMYICKLQPRFHLKIIEKSFRYMYALIKKLMRSVRTSSHFHPILQLEAGEVEWLGLNAYIKVLKKKQSRHKELLRLLKSKLVAHEINGNISSQLKFAVDSSHSSVMWKIKY